MREESEVLTKNEGMDLNLADSVMSRSYLRYSLPGTSFFRLHVILSHLLVLFKCHLIVAFLAYLP